MKLSDKFSLETYFCKGNKKSGEGEKEKEREREKDRDVCVCVFVCKKDIR